MGDRKPGREIPHSQEHLNSIKKEYADSFSSPSSTEERVHPKWKEPFNWPDFKAWFYENVGEDRRFAIQEWMKSFPVEPRSEARISWM